jgi:putative acetyltransferase
MSDLQIRASRPDETEQLLRLHRAAFAGDGHAGYDESEQVAALVERLLRASPAIVSLVAEDDGTLVGHILFSPAWIRGFDDIRCAILSPMAVVPIRQKAGIGTSLIRAGLSRLEAEGVQAVFVLGDPAYYGRSGFHVDHRVAAPYDLPYPEAWQAIELQPGVLADVSGTLVCLPALMSPELW